MRLAELPAYYERNNLVAWRNSFANRVWGWPYIIYTVKYGNFTYVLEAKANVDIDPLLKILGNLGETMEDITLLIVTSGSKGDLTGTYFYKKDNACVVVDPVVGDRCNIMVVQGDDVLMISAEAKAKVGLVYRLLKQLTRTKGGQT